MKTLWSMNTILVMCCLLVCVKGDWLQQLHSGETIAVGDGVKVRVDKISDGVNQTSYFSSHVLRVYLWDIGMTIAKAARNDGLRISLFTPGESENSEARGEAHLFSVILPLLIGFKIAGSILTTLVAVLIVSLKAFLAAKVAILLSGSLALKKMVMQDPHSDIHYPVEYHSYSPPFEEHGPSATGHEVSHHSAPSSSGPSAHEDVVADSNISELYVDKNSTTPTVKRRVYKRKNPIIPIFSIHKIIRHQTN